MGCSICELVYEVPGVVSGGGAVHGCGCGVVHGGSYGEVSGGAALAVSHHNQKVQGGMRRKVALKNYYFLIHLNPGDSFLMFTRSSGCQPSFFHLPLISHPWQLSQKS